VIWMMLLLLGADEPTKDITPQLMIGRAKLQMGRWREARVAFQSALERRPRSWRAKEGLATSLAGMGRCSGALELLGELREKHWTAALAVAEGQCRMRTGDRSGARVAFEEALWLEGGQPTTRYQAAILTAELGDDPGPTLEVLENSDPVWALTARATIASERGDPDLDALLWQLDAAAERAGPRSQMLILDGLRWLRLGHVSAADEAFYQALRASPSHVRAGALRAEARRRLGDTLQATAVMGRSFLLRTEQTPLLLAVRSRIQADLGDLEQAEGMLSELPRPDSAEALASRWYLARARGHMVREEALADGYARAFPDAEPLENLVPLVPLR
jgi:Flp pilus assembly protein TadD